MFFSFISWRRYILLIVIAGLIGTVEVYARGAIVDTRTNEGVTEVDNGALLHNANEANTVRRYDNRNALDDDAVYTDDPTCEITQHCYSDGNCIPMQVCD